MTRRTDWTRLIVVAAGALLLVLILERIFWEIAYPLALVFAGVVIAQGLAPVVNWMSIVLPRSLAAVVLYVALLTVLGGVVWLLMPPLIAQAQQFTTALPAIEGELHEQFDRWSPVAVDQIVSAGEGIFLQLFGPLLQLPVAIAAALTNLVLVFFLSLYWLIAQPKLRGWVLSLIPDAARDDGRELLREVGETVGGYVRGVLISALVVATLTYAGLLLIGLPSALLLALIAGIGEFIPVLGPFLAAGPAVGVALATGEANPLVILAFYVGLQQVESNILLPVIMRGQARIPPLLSLVAFLVGAAVGGIVGALIAIPLFGALRVVTISLLVPAQRQMIGVSQAEANSVRRQELAREEVAHGQAGGTNR